MRRARAITRVLLGQHAWIVTSTAWSPDGKWIASGSLGSGTVWCRPASLAPAAPGSPLILDTNHIRELQWFPDSRRLLAVGVTSGAAIWDVIDRRQLTNYPASTAQISKDGTRLVTCEGQPRGLGSQRRGRSGLVARPDIRPGSSFPDARLAALSPSGKKIALSDILDKIDIFDADTGVLEDRLMGSGKVWAMVFSDDDQALVVTGFEPDVRVWRLGGTKRHSWSVGRGIPCPHGMPLFRPTARDC